MEQGADLMKLLGKQAPKANNPGPDPFIGTGTSEERLNSFKEADRISPYDVPCKFKEGDIITPSGDAVFGVRPKGQGKPHRVVKALTECVDIIDEGRPLRQYNMVIDLELAGAIHRFVEHSDRYELYDPSKITEA